MATLGDRDMMAWITNDNLNTIIAIATLYRIEILLTAQQWAEVREFCEPPGGQAVDPVWVREQRASVALYGPSVVLVDDEERSTPAQLGMLA